MLPQYQKKSVGIALRKPKTERPPCAFIEVNVQKPECAICTAAVFVAKNYVGNVRNGTVTFIAVSISPLCAKG